MVGNYFLTVWLPSNSVNCSVQPHDHGPPASAPRLHPRLTGRLQGQACATAYPRLWAEAPALPGLAARACPCCNFFRQRMAPVPLGRGGMALRLLLRSGRGATRPLPGQPCHGLFRQCPHHRVTRVCSGEKSKNEGEASPPSDSGIPQSSLAARLDPKEASLSLGQRLSGRDSFHRPQALTRPEAVFLSPG